MRTNKKRTNAYANEVELEKRVEESTGGERGRQDQHGDGFCGGG